MRNKSMAMLSGLLLLLVLPLAASADKNAEAPGIGMTGTFTSIAA